MSDLSFPEIVEPPPADSKPALAHAGQKTDVAVAASAAIDLTKVTLKDVALAQFGQWQDQVAAAEKAFVGVIFDLSTATKLKEAKSRREALINQPRADARKTSKALKSATTQLNKDVTAHEEQIVAAFNTAEKAITEQIDARESEIEADRVAEIQRKAKHETGIATIRGYLQQAQGLPAMRIASGIALLEGMTFGAEWEEFVELATAARDETLAALRRLHDDTIAAELRAVEEARIRKEHAEQQQALQIGQLALGLMGKPAADIRQQLNLLELTIYQEGTAAVVQQAHDSAVATLKTMLELAEERERRLAQEADAKRKADAALAAAEIQAPPVAPVADGSQDSDDGAAISAVKAGQEPTEGDQACSEHAREGMEPEVCESTEGRGTIGAPALATLPAHESPGVGPMGAGQPADAGPSGGSAPDGTLTALVDALAFTKYAAAPFFGRFPSHPKTTPEWWAGLREQIECLQPMLVEAIKRNGGVA